MSKYIILAFTIIAATVGSYAGSAFGTVVSLTGSVFNEVSKEPLTVNIKLYDANGKRKGATRSMAVENGSYYLTGLRAGEDYIIELNKKGYFKEVFKVTVPDTDKYLEVSRDFLIKPLEKGVQIPMPVAPFELRKSKLRYGADLFINDMIQSLKNNPSIKVQIVSYPDAGLDPSAAQTLTKERADALNKFFTENGIDANRLTTKGVPTIDPNNPVPTEKQAKGKRYIGKSYLVVTDFDPVAVKKNKMSKPKIN